MAADLVFAYSDDVFRHLPESLTGASPDAAFVGLQWSSLEHIRNHRWPELTPENLISLEAAEELDRMAERMADEWYLGPRGEDFTDYHGISIGRCYKSVLRFYWFIHIYKFLEMARSAVQQTRPKVVWCDREAPHYLVLALESLAKDSSNPFSLKMVGDSGDAQSNETMQKQLRGMSMDSAPVHVSPFRLWREECVWRLYTIGVICRRFFKSTKRPSRRIFASYYPTLTALYKTLLTDPWKSAFELSMVQRPGRELLLQCFQNGVRILWPYTRRTLSRAEPTLTPDQELRIKGMRETWQRWDQNPDYASRFRWKGHSPWPSIREAIENEVIQKLPSMAKWIREISDVFESQMPAALLLDSDNLPWACALAKAAKNAGVQAVTVLHGIPGGYDRIYGMDAAYLAVGGPMVSSLYQANGRSKEGIWTDCGCQFDQNSSALTRAVNRTGEKRKSILIIPQPYEWVRGAALVDDAERCLIDVLKTLKRFPAMRTTIKLHPSQSVEHYRSLTAGKFECMITQKGSIDEMLLSHDLVICSASTVLIQAALFQRPMIFTNFTRMLYPPPFEEGWGFPVARTTDQLADALKTWSEQPPHYDYSRLLDQFVGVQDGRACERLLTRVKTAAETAGIPVTP